MKDGVEALDRKQAGGGRDSCKLKIHSLSSYFLVEKAGGKI